MVINIYYSTIKLHSILNDDNWECGGNASSFMSDNPKGRYSKIEVSRYGKTKEEARKNLIKFLSVNGKQKIKCVGKFLK